MEKLRSNTHQINKKSWKSFFQILIFLAGTVCSILGLILLRPSTNYFSFKLVCYLANAICWFLLLIGKISCMCIQRRMNEELNKEKKNVKKEIEKIGENNEKI